MWLGFYTDRHLVGPPDNIVYKENDDVDIHMFRDELCSSIYSGGHQWMHYVSHDLCNAVKILYGDHLLILNYCSKVMNLFRNYKIVKSRYNACYNSRTWDSYTLNNIIARFADVDNEVDLIHSSNIRESCVIGPAYTYFIVTTLVRDRNENYMKSLLSKVNESCNYIHNTIDMI